MSVEIARALFNTGRGHALSADLLFRSSYKYAEENGFADPDHFAFNGTFSLSVHHLLGLGLELMLKAAFVALGGGADDNTLKRIGHDLTRALESAEGLGFRSEAPYLRGILEVLREPYGRDWFRYRRPPEFNLPADFKQVTETLQVLDEELHALLGLD